MNLTFLAVTSGQLTSYFNYGFIAIAVIGLVGFLIGFFRGVWKETISLIYYGVAICCLVFLMPKIVNFTFNFDVSSILSSVMDPSQLQGIKSLGDLLEKGITDFIVSNNLGSAVEAVDFAKEVSYSLLAFILFVVLTLVVILLEMIICPLLYHLIFKWFIPKRVRKHHKLKLVSGLMRFVSTIVVTCLFISPFTALLTSTNNHFRDENGNVNLDKNNSNELYSSVASVLEGYNSSILANIIYSFSQSGKGFDIDLMDKITGTDFDENNHLNFFEEFGNVSSILVDALKTGAFDVTNKTIDLTILVQSEFIKNALYSLADSTLICVAFPIATSLALNGVGNNMEVDFSNVDMKSINWSDSLKAVGDVFDAIKDTGYIETAIQDPNAMMDNIVISRDKAVYLNEALDIFGSTQLVTTLMPQLLVSYLTSMRDKAPTEEVVSMNHKLAAPNDKNIYQTLPEEAFKVETYSSIDWSKELTSMLDIVLDVADQFKTTKGSDLTLRDVTTMFTPENVQTVLLGIDDNRVYDEESDYDDNVYLNGGEVNGVQIKGTKRILGVSDDPESKGLFDLQTVDLLMFDFGLVTEYIPSLFGDVAKDHQDIIDEIVSVIETWDKPAWKNELGSLLNLSVPLYKTSKVVSNNQDIITSISEGEGNVALSYISDHMEGSYLISNLIPDIMQDYVSDEKNDMDLFLGIKLSDMNFTKFSEGSSFASEFGFLVKDLLRKASVITELTDTTNSPIDLMIENQEKLTGLLESVYTSEILNREITPEEESTGLLSNFNKIMVNLFSSPTSEDIANGTDLSLNIPTLTNDLISFDRSLILGIEDTKGWFNETETGEINSIFNVITSLKKNTDIDSTEYLYQFIKGDITDLNAYIYDLGNEVERIFATIDDSLLMKDAFPKTITMALEGNANINKYADFNNVESWADEGTCFRSVLDQLKALNLGDGGDIVDKIQNIDDGILKEYEFAKPENVAIANKYAGSYDKYYVENSKSYSLLDAINSTQSFKTTELLYDSIVNVLDTDPNGNSGQLVSDETLLEVKNDFIFDPNSIKYDESIYISWNLDSTKLGTYNGEIYNLSRLLSYSNSLNSIDTLATEDFDEVLGLIVKAYPFRTLINELLNTSLHNLCESSSESIVKSIFDDNTFDYDALTRLSFDYSETDNIVYRVDEVKARMNETSAITVLYDHRNDFNDMDSIIAFAQSSDCNKVLKDLHDSEYFNASYFINMRETIPGSSKTRRTRMTSFENLFNQIAILNEDLGDSAITVEEFDELHNREDNDLWIGEKGEINSFFNVMTSLKKNDAPDSTDYLFQYIKGDLLSLDDHIYDLGNEIERIFATIDDSFIMKKLFPTTVNSALKSNETISKYTDFNRITNWTEEGTSFRNVLDLLKSQNLTASSNFVEEIQNFDAKLIKEHEFLLPQNSAVATTYGGSYDKYYINESNIYNLLDGINSTQSFDFNSLLYDSVYNALDTNKAGDEGQLVTDKTLLDAKSDFIIEDNTIKYDDSIYVSWKLDTKNIGTYNGETYNIARLLTHSDALNKIETLSNEEFEEVINLTVKAYPFRTLVNELLSNSLVNIKNTSTEPIVQSLFDENSLDFKALERLSFDYSTEDTINNRKDEINERLNETTAITILYSHRNDFKDMDAIVDFSQSTDCYNVLTSLHDSEFFNPTPFALERIPVAGTSKTVRTKMTSFEKLFNQIAILNDDLGEEAITLNQFDELYNRETNDKWLGEKGEINSFFKVMSSLRKTSEPDSTEYLYNYMKGALPTLGDHIFDLGNEIERIFAMIDDSFIMRTIFPKTVNSALASNASISKYTNFEKVENWALEGTSFRKVLDQMKALNLTGDVNISSKMQEFDKELLTHYQFTLPENNATSTLYEGSYDKYYIAKSHVYNLLDGISSTQSFDFNGLLYDSVYEAFDTNKTGSEGQLVSDQALIDAKSEFEIAPNTIKYNDTIYVSWNLDEANIGTYNGETYNIARLLSVSSNLNTIETLPNEEFEEVLGLTVKAFPFRTIVTELVENSLLKVKNSTDVVLVKNIFDEKIFDFRAFTRLSYDYEGTNSIANRMDEVEARLEETKSIATLYANKESFKDLHAILAITDGGANSTLSKVLLAMHNSEFFNSSLMVAKRDATNKRNNLTAFENLFNEILSLNSELSKYKMTIEEFEELQNREVNDLWLGENGEIVNFNNSIDILVTLDISKVEQVKSVIIHNAMDKFILEQKRVAAYNFYKNLHPSYTKDQAGFLDDVRNGVIKESQLPPGIKIVDIIPDYVPTTPVEPDPGTPDTGDVSKKIDAAYSAYKAEQEAKGLPVQDKNTWLGSLLISGKYPEGVTQEDIKAALGK